MKINPYESPRVGDPAEEQAMGDADSIRQLLTEIRDAQRELLQLQRDALLRQRRSLRFILPLMLIPVALGFLPLYFTMTRTRPVPPTPFRVAPRVAPQIVPPGVPSGASLSRQ
jgi:hypothetical protein